MTNIPFATLFHQKVKRGEQMLVLSRKVGETIWIGENIEIVISEVKGEQVKIAIKPLEVSILFVAN